ncbi:MAG: hypothetical protein RL095_772 [Verrucomicrobiota bacterium]|jgi:hypothetical protein
MSLILGTLLAFAAPDANGISPAAPAPATKVKSAREAPSEALVRRLYLDLLDRLPEIDEFESSVRQIDAGNYPQLVEQLMKSQEYQLNLAAKVVEHYAPKERTHGLVDYKRLERHLKDNYLKPGKDFRIFLEDMLKARGIAVSNLLVLFYNDKETPAQMTARFTERVMAVPMGCAECHDHRIHPDIKITDFWSLAAFYQGFDKTFVKNEVELNALAKTLENKEKPRQQLGTNEYKRVLAWIKAERQGKSIYDDLSAKEKMGIDPSNRVEMNSAEDLKKRNRNDVNTPTLLAPQLYLYEDKERLNEMTITYPVDGKSYTAKARLFGADRGIQETKTPRDVLAKWMATRQNEFVSRAVANWVGHWLLGRGLALPVNDVYDMKNASPQLVACADYLEKERWDINALVRMIVLSPAYRLPSSLQNDEEKFMAFKARRFRHLNGDQLVNSLNGAYLARLRRDTSIDALRQLYAAEVDRNQLVQKLFPSSLNDSEANYRGALTQSLYLSSDTRMLEFTHKLAQAGYSAHQGLSHDAWLDSLFVRFYTRHPSPQEIAFFGAKLDATKSYSQSGFFETVWTLINSPEMRLY